MKKGFVIALITGAIVSGLGLIQPGVASAAPDCTGVNNSYGAVVVPGNLRVTGVCTLNGSTVTGSVTIVPGGSLTMTGATVHGSLTQTGGTLASFNSTIRGSVTVTGTDDGSLNDICGGTIGGSVTVRNVTEPVGGPGYFRLLGMGAPIPVNGPCSTLLAIPELRIGGAVTFQGNQIYVRLGHATNVGGSVSVTGNTSSTYGNSGDISANRIRGSLSCSLTNVPAVSNLLGANTVTGSRSGQCAGF